MSRFRALDFLKIESVLAETAAIKDELKRAVEKAVTGRDEGRAGAMIGLDVLQLQRRGLSGRERRLAAGGGAGRDPRWRRLAARSGATTRKQTITEATPNTTAPSPQPASTPLAPYNDAPTQTNGMTPSVERPQLKTVE